MEEKTNAREAHTGSAHNSNDIEDLGAANTALRQMDEAVAVLDEAGRVMSCSPAYSRISGLAVADALGQPALIGEAHAGNATLLELLDRAATHGRWQGEVSSRRKNGDVYSAYVKIEAEARPRPDGPCFVLVFGDMSGAKAYEARIEYLAYYDALTGLANRALIEKRAAQVARDGRFLALLFLDLDGFKTINDSLGHAAGDELLRHVGRRLQAVVTKTDTVARQSGDEFVVLLDSIARPQDAAYVAAKLMQALKVPLTLEGQTVFTTASIGISCYPDDGTDLAALMRNADAAMYRSKRQGHDRYEYYRPEMNANAHWLLSVRTNLYQALEREEFRLYYQPFVDLKTGCITGIEALIRWQNAELGMVSPTDFIPIAEETGLILSIGAWVLRQACNELAALHAAGYSQLRISVNLSARQFRQSDLVEQIAAVLTETGLQGRFLELEITETVLMEQAETTIDALHALEQLGVTVALDDFGTGYSSLSYLKRFPINYLKIDKSFIDGIPDEEGDNAITRTIINMARSLNINVIAEGVEHNMQSRWLEYWRCEEAQGYFFSLPLAADDLRWLLREHSTLPVAPATATPTY